MKLREFIYNFFISTLSTLMVTLALKINGLYFIVILIFSLFVLLVIKTIMMIFMDLYGKKLGSNFENEILNHCINSKKINIFVMKGGLFTKQDQKLYSIFSPKYSDINIRFMMANPDSPAIKHRAKEIFDRPYEHYKKETIISLETIQMLSQKQNNIKVHIHNKEAYFRFIYTDNFLFISFFIPNQYASNTPFYRFNKSSVLYKVAEKFFEYVYYNESDEV